MNDNQQGFTLVEILVVIIIVGVLASLALPLLFRNVERSRATEALGVIGAVKRQVEACAMPLNNNFTTCNDYTLIGMIDPSYNASTNASAHYAYTITTAATSFQVVATRNAFENGNAGDTITLDRAADGSITRAGTTAFIGIR